MSWGSGNARGIIERVVRDGELNGITGTKADPVALIRIYRKLRDKMIWMPIGKHATNKFSAITKLESRDAPQGENQNGN